MFVFLQSLYARENYDRSRQYNRSESPASEVVGKVQKYSNLLGKVQGTFWYVRETFGQLHWASHLKSSKNGPNLRKRVKMATMDNRNTTHGVATYQRSKNLTMTTFKTMVNTKEPVMGKTVPQSAFRLKTHHCHRWTQPAKRRAGTLTLNCFHFSFLRPNFCQFILVICAKLSLSSVKYDYLLQVDPAL